MKQVKTSLSILFLFSLIMFSCKGDEGTDPAPTDNTGGTNEIPMVNTVTFDGTTIQMTERTCTPNSFGKPRLGFSAKNDDKSISANIELRGTDPGNGASFTIDPDLDNKTSNVKFYYDSKNWVGRLDPNNTVKHISDDTKRNIQATQVLVENKADANETMMVDFNLTCDK